MMKKLGKIWSSLTPNDKKVYEEVAKKDRLRYDEEIKNLTKNGQTLDKLQEVQTKRPKKCLSAYMIFVKQRRRLISDSNPHMPVLQIMKEVGKEWKSLDAQGRVKYEKLADVDKIRYKEELKEFQKEVEKLHVVTSNKVKTSPKNSKIENKPSKRKRTKQTVVKKKLLADEIEEADISELKMKRNMKIK